MYTSYGQHGNEDGKPGPGHLEALGSNLDDLGPELLLCRVCPTSSCCSALVGDIQYYDPTIEQEIHKGV